MNYEKIISPEEFDKILTDKEDVLIIDLREQTSFFKPVDEAVHVPVSSIVNNIGVFSKSKKIVLYCWHGVDSYFVMNLLWLDYGFENVYSLKGGIEGWYKFLKEKNRLSKK